MTRKRGAMVLNKHTMNALTFSKFGTADVLEYREVAIPTVGDGEVLVEMKAIGLNFADIYRRKGNYHLKGEPPFIAGYEGSGVVVLSKSNRYSVGERVAFCDVPFANAEYVKVGEEHIIPLDESMSFELAASLLLQGLTAHYLTHDSYPVQKGDTVLIHAAAGGVGQILTQICKLKGASVIGLTRGEEKLSSVKKSGADVALLLDENWQKHVLEITDGQGVTCVYDSVGSTLKKSLSVTKECGTVVFYGMSGGDPESVNPRELMDRSITLTGGDLWSFLKTSHDRISRATELFQWISEKKIVLSEAVKFKLSEGKLAHEFLESGKSLGKVLLIP